MPKTSWFLTVLSLYLIAEYTITMGAAKRIEKLTRDTGIIMIEALSTTISRKVLKKPAVKTSREVKTALISDRLGLLNKQKIKVAKLDIIK